MFKKFTAIILTICFLFAFSSCGENGSHSSPLKKSEFISSALDKKTSFRYDEYEDYVIVTGIVGAPDNIEIPETISGKEVKAIGTGAFSDMGWVKNIDIPDTVVEIGEKAFYGAVSAEKISLSESLYEIGSSAFFGCRNAVNVRLPLGLKIIGGFSFAECTKLEGISVPKGVKSIGGGAFQGTEWLKKQTDEFVTAGDGVLILYNGESEKVEIPDGVKEISAFNDNFFVRKISLPDSVERIGEYAFINSSLEKIHLGKNITEIGKSAFDSCLNLKEVTLGEKTEKIGAYAFAGCLALEEITLPKKLESVGAEAFAKCEGLKKLTIQSEKTEIGENICESCSEELTIYCPKNSPAVDYAKKSGFILDII